MESLGDGYGYIIINKQIGNGMKNEMVWNILMGNKI